MAASFQGKIKDRHSDLAQSDYAGGFDCTMIISEDSMRYSMALAIQEYLKELNINMELVKVSADEHTSYQFGGIFDADGNRDYDMIMAGWAVCLVRRA